MERHIDNFGRWKCIKIITKKWTRQTKTTLTYTLAELSQSVFFSLNLLCIIIRINDETVDKWVFVVGFFIAPTSSYFCWNKKKKKTKNYHQFNWSEYFIMPTPNRCLMLFTHFFLLYGTFCEKFSSYSQRTVWFTDHVCQNEQHGLWPNTTEISWVGWPKSTPKTSDEDKMTIRATFIAWIAFWWVWKWCIKLASTIADLCRLDLTQKYYR